MKEFSYVITDELGIHARPAGMLVKEAAKYEAAITIEKAGKTADAKRLFAVMGLAAKKNDEIKIAVEGADEEQAAAGIEAFLKKNL